MRQAGVLLVGAIAAVCPVEPQVTSLNRVSVSSSGRQGNAYSDLICLDGSGQLAAFRSDARALVPDDTNNFADVFVRNLGTRTTVRVSVSSTGEQAEPAPSGASASRWPSLDAAGTVVAFDSSAPNLVPGDTNGKWDVFLHDLVSGATTLVSQGLAGAPANFGSTLPAVSANGRYVAFASWASNLVAGDTNGTEDIFVLDRTTGGMQLVSVDSAGQQGNAMSCQGGISADGQFVVFRSWASNLVPGDTNDLPDVFVRDLGSGTTARVNVSSTGEQANGDSRCARNGAITADGRLVVFHSAASNLVPDDTNGQPDIFVRDRQTGQTTRVGLLAPAVPESNAELPAPAAISANGRWVTFASEGRLVSADQNSFPDIYAVNLVTAALRLVSITPSASAGNQSSNWPCLNTNGRRVGFRSVASDLVANDSNGVRDVFVAAVTSREPPTLDWAGTPGLTSGGVIPRRGQPGDRFAFRAKLIDSSGREPDFVRLILTRDGCPYQTLDLNPWGGALTTGRLYSIARRLPAGNYTYRFAASTGRLAATGPPTRARLGPIMSVRPYLVWAGSLGFTGDGVEPGSGVPNRTRFRFRVRYRAHDRTPADFVRVELRRNGGRYETWEMTALRGVSPIGGIVYGATGTLPVGTYTHQFLAANANGSAVGPASQVTVGPTVGSGGLLAISAIATAPTPGGTQVTFTLTAPASVRAEILNLAGRHVATVAPRKSLASGTQTLVWNGRAATGLRAPSGRYLVRLEARAPDGTVSRGIAAAMLSAGP